MNNKTKILAAIGAGGLATALAAIFGLKREATQAMAMAENDYEPAALLENEGEALDVNEEEDDTTED